MSQDIFTWDSGLLEDRYSTIWSLYEERDIVSGGVLLYVLYAIFVIRTAEISIATGSIICKII